MRLYREVLIVFVSAAVNAAAGSSPMPIAQGGVTPPVVVITAREYAFDAPDTVESGPTTIRLVSRGREEHFVGLIRIASPHTFAEFRRNLSVPGATPWTKSVGGVGTIPPGGVATTTLDLAPGLYAMLCDMQDAKGTPHMMEGMIRPLRVSERRNDAVMPNADGTIELSEYAFAVHVPLNEGLHVITVRNVGTLPHMALLWRLHSGKSAAEAVHWMITPTDTEPPPVTLMGGTPDLDPGQEAELSTRLKHGRYLLICLVGDDRAGKPHYARGMIREIAIGAPQVSPDARSTRKPNGQAL